MATLDSHFRALVLDNEPGGAGTAHDINASPKTLASLAKRLAKGHPPDFEVDYSASNFFGYFTEHRLYRGPFQHVFSFVPNAEVYRPPIRRNLIPNIAHTLIIACCEEVSQLYALPNTMLLPEWRALFQRALEVQDGDEEANESDVDMKQDFEDSWNEFRELFGPEDPEKLTPTQQQIRDCSLDLDSYQVSFSLEGDITEVWVIHLLF